MSVQLCPLVYTMDMLLRTLGSLEFLDMAFARPKPLLLLAYLVLEGPKERRYLAELFFPEAADPLNRLAVTLSRLRKVGVGLVEANTVRAWTEIESDATRLLAASERADHNEVIRLYGGSFLEGVACDGCSGELEEWIYSTRDLLAGHVKTAHLALAQRAAEESKFQDAAKRAEAALKIAQTVGLEVEDIRRAHTLLLAGNHPRAATLREEAACFDLSLLATVDEARSALGYSAAPPTNLGSRVSSFVGRSRELADLGSMLARPDARLITVVGGGGVGKTRLATEAAREQLGAERFKDGVYFVALDAVSSSNLVPSKIAEALGLELESGDLPFSQLRRHLGNKAVLLVLDNFEHLLDGAPMLVDLLESCPHLKLLVTSREGLNLKEEWLFPLNSLPFYCHGDAEPPLAFDATRLFVERARQVQPSFKVDPDTLRAVQTICQLLHGYPLGLELAATLVRAVACAEIAGELAQNLDFLNASIRNLPERHQSLRAVFEHSWKLLTPREQTTLRRLAVFRGGFTRAAAAEIVGATTPVLLSLVDKSLLRVSETGHYDRHPLLYGYTQEKLAEHPEERAEVAAKHAEYFSRFSAGLRLEFNGPDPKGTFARLEAEFENCRAAWRWALEKRNVGVMLGLTNAF